MTKEQFTDALSGIDQSYIAESLEYRDDTSGQHGFLRHVPVAAGIVLAVLLVTPVVSAVIHQRPRQTKPLETYTDTVPAFFPEPAVRPDISDIWVWDTSRGVYVWKPEYTTPSFESITRDWTDEQWEQYYADEEARAQQEANQPTLYEQLDAATDPLDIALIKGLIFLKENPVPLTDELLLSASGLSPELIENYRKAMSSLDNEAAKSIWTRFCATPKLRELMIPAIEGYLSIDVNGSLVFFSDYAQNVWYERFCALKSCIPTEITNEVVPVYGKLLLPGLCEKESLTEAELAAFAKLTGTEDVESWKAENADTLRIIRHMIDTTPKYVEK